MKRQYSESCLLPQFVSQDESGHDLSSLDVQSILLSIRLVDATNSFSGQHATQLIRLLSSDEIDYQLYSSFVKKCLCSSGVIRKLFLGAVEWSEDELSLLSDLSNPFVKLLHLYLLKLLNTDLHFERSCVSIVAALVALKFRPRYSQLCQALLSQFFKTGGLWCISLEDFVCLRSKYEGLSVFDEFYVRWEQETRLNCLRDDTSSKFQHEITISHFYSLNPYPLWRQVDALMLKDTTCRDRSLSAFPGKLDVNKVQSILVAGCGTGQEAVVYALLFPCAQVFAVDLSASSLQCAEKLAERYRVCNLNFSRVDLLDLTPDQGSYDLVVSSGVLHHLDVPLQGLKVLSGLRRSGGFLKIGLYSKVARACVEQARSILPPHFRGVPWLSNAELVQARRFLVGSFESIRGLSRLLWFEDFFEMNAFRDLLFNPCEHAYDPFSIASMLGECGLEFDGFQFHDQSVLNTYRKLFPHDVACRDLAAWQSFEELFPKSFAGMYNFWCH